MKLCDSCRDVCKVKPNKAKFKCENCGVLYCRSCEIQAQGECNMCYPALIKIKK